MEPIEYLKIDLDYAGELLNAGKTEQALHEYGFVVGQVKTHAPSLWKKRGSGLLTQEAVGYLRLGEQQNCCATNNSHSCLIPISGAGIHTKQDGSRGAITCLTEALRLSPDNTSARWLLNIAYMTLGGYPRNVPSKWLIPLKDYGGDYPMKKFTNAAPRMGLDLLGWSGSVIMEDFEGNGLLDLVVSSFRPDGQLRYFRNNGDGTFSERTKEAGLLGEVGGLNLITTDYNNDGRPDIVVLRGGWLRKNGYYPLSLLRNDGNGHFTDVTLQAGLLTLGPTQTAVAFDYNGDGFLDLFVGYEGESGVPASCKLFRNNGNGTFTDVTKLCGLDVTRYVKGVVSADFTHSGRPGLYLSCLDGPNILLRNDGPAGPDRSSMAPWRFTDVSHQAGVDKQRGSFSCFFFDYDNDGWLDFYVGTGNPDLGMLIPKRMFRNHDGHYFDEVTTTGDFGHLQKGHGIAFGDLNNNGQQDVFIVLGGAFEGDTAHDALFVNPGTRNHWVTLALSGTKSNRIAVGAEICVRVATPQGDRRIYRTVSTGGSFGNNPLRQEIGLGNATAIKEVSIHWPASGIEQTLTHLSMDCFYKIREGDPNPERWHVPTFKLPVGSDVAYRQSVARTAGAGRARHSPGADGASRP